MRNNFQHRTLQRELPDLGERKRGRLRCCFKGFKPGPDGLAKFPDCDSLKLRGIMFQSSQCGAEQGRRACEIAALQVMKGRGDLDQGLEKFLLRLNTLEPFGFPMFVSREELLVVIAVKSVGQWAA